jgi:hypothetical protein
MKYRFILPIVAMCLSLVAQAQIQTTYLKVASSHRWFSGRYYELEHTNYMYKATNPRTYQPNLDRWSYDTSLTFYPNAPTTPVFGYRQTFDAQGRVIFLDHDSWNAGVPEPGSRIAYTYDANGNLLTATRQSYQAPGSYSNVSRVSYTYNASNQVTEQANENWAGGTGIWVVFDRIVYTYNSNNQLIEEVVQKNQSPLPWAGQTRKLYTYTGNNNTMIVSEVRSSGWVPVYRLLNSFDANGKITGIERHEWMTSYWKNIDSMVLTLDNNGNVLLQEARAWDGSAYVHTTAHSYTWVATATPSGFSMASNTAKTWNSTTNTYAPVTDDDSISYFHDVVVSVPGTPALAQPVNIYPNPAGGFVHLGAVQSTYHAIITDMAGRVVKTCSGDGKLTTRLDVQDIPAGNYILQVHAGGNVSVEKLVIAR